MERTERVMSVRFPNGEAGTACLVLSWLAMKQFYLNVSEVLATIAEVVLPRTFEQLREYGLR
jgi:hypothetical protein